MTLSETPVGTPEGSREQPLSPSPLPFGPDWTRGEEPSPADRKTNEMFRAAAFGRAKGKLLEALDLPEPARDEAITKLILSLIDWAIDGADTRIILNGLR